MWFTFVAGVIFLLDSARLQARGQNLQEILAVPSPDKYSLLPGSRLKEAKAAFQTMLAATCSSMYPLRRPR
jgi:hypothetical protein